MATRIDYYPAGDKHQITNQACFARAAMITARTVWGTYRGRAGGRLIRNQPKRQVAPAMLALGDQLRVPAHPSFLQKARQPGTCQPNPDLSASRFTSPRNQLSDRCFQLPTASREGDQALVGTSKMRTHPPGTLFILKPPVNSHQHIIKREPYLFCHPSVSDRQSLIYRKMLM